MNVCFKCGSTEDLVPFGKSAAYLAPRISLCRGCIGEAPKHEPDREFDCGCTETRTLIVETHWRSPWSACPACQGDGKIKDRHHYLQARRDIGASDERGRLGYAYVQADDPSLLALPRRRLGHRQRHQGDRPDAGAASKGARPGRSELLPRRRSQRGRRRAPLGDDPTGRGSPLRARDAHEPLASSRQGPELTGSRGLVRLE
jgi:hypothetical protein